MKNNQLLLLLSMMFCISITSFAGNNKAKKGIAVLEEARQLLEDKEHWNSEDDGMCIDDHEKQTYSLYCAIYQSQITINGKYKHRGLLMKTVRSTVSQVAKDEKLRHPIRDYNNLESTRHEAILDVLTIATAQLKRKILMR